MAFGFGRDIDREHTAQAISRTFLSLRSNFCCRTPQDASLLSTSLHLLLLSRGFYLRCLLHLNSFLLFLSPQLCLPLPHTSLSRCLALLLLYLLDSCNLGKSNRFNSFGLSLSEQIRKANLQALHDLHALRGKKCLLFLQLAFHAELVETHGNPFAGQISPHEPLYDWCSAHALNNIEDVLLLEPLAYPPLYQFHLLQEVLEGSPDFKGAYEMLYFRRRHVLFHVENESVVVEVQLFHVVFQKLLRCQDCMLLCVCRARSSPC